MAKQIETSDSARLLQALQKRGWFKKYSDTVQVGIPDIMGLFKKRFFAFEVKSVTEIPEDGIVPTRSSHRFSPKQVGELKEIWRNGGIAFGVVICGRTAFLAVPGEINEYGQININTLASFPTSRLVREGEDWELDDLLNFWSTSVSKTKGEIERA